MYTCALAYMALFAMMVSEEDTAFSLLNAGVLEGKDNNLSAKMTTTFCILYYAMSGETLTIAWISATQLLAFKLIKDNVKLWSWEVLYEM